MNETDYNAALYDKMRAEQDRYRDWLLAQPPAEIDVYKRQGQPLKCAFFDGQE